MKHRKYQAVAARATTPPVVVPTTERVAPKSRAGDCTACPEARERLIAEGRLSRNANYTQIYATRGTIRYCRCTVCGATWKVSISSTVS